MSTTQFVQMYHPAIPETSVSPVLVPAQSVDDYGARGWLRVDAEPLPAPSTPYYTTSAADSRFMRVSDAGTSGTLTGDALRAAFGLGATATDQAVEAFVATQGTRTRAELDQNYTTVTTRDPLGTNLVKLGQMLAISASSWDNYLVESPCIHLDPVSGRWAMTYVGYNNTGGTLRAKVGLAYSDDLVTWEKQGTAPIFEGSGVGGDPDSVGTSGPVWLYENGTYHLFYIGLTGAGYEAGTKSLCHATATSLTGPWTRHGAIISPNPAVPWRDTAIWHANLIKRGDTWYLFFNANGTVEQIGYATASSLDGPWTVDDANSPIVPVGAAGTWDEQKAGDPCVRFAGGQWIMDYFGYSAAGVACDGVATTTDDAFPLGWTKYANNPILSPSPDGYDSQFSHKPWTMVVGGQVLHYYTATSKAGGARSIGLAVTAPTADSSAPLRVLAKAKNGSPAAWFPATVSEGLASTVVVGPDDLRASIALGKTRLTVGNKNGGSDVLIGQDSARGLVLSWAYNATAANATAALETWGGANRLNIQNNAGAGGVTLGGSGGKVGFYGTTPATKPVLSYSRSGSGETAALAALRTALASLGLITDSTTA